MIGIILNIQAPIYIVSNKWLSNHWLAFPANQSLTPVVCSAHYLIYVLGELI